MKSLGIKLHIVRVISYSVFSHLCRCICDLQLWPHLDLKEQKQKKKTLFSLLKSSVWIYVKLINYE